MTNFLDNSLLEDIAVKEEMAKKERMLQRLGKPIRKSIAAINSPTKKSIK